MLSRPELRNLRPARRMKVKRKRKEPPPGTEALLSVREQRKGRKKRVSNRLLSALGKQQHVGLFNDIYLFHLSPRLRLANSEEEKRLFASYNLASVPFYSKKT